MKVKKESLSLKKRRPLLNKKKRIVLPIEAPPIPVQKEKQSVAEIERLCERGSPTTLTFKNKGCTYNSYLKIYSMVTGCGLLAMQGNTSMYNLEPEEMARLKKELWDKTGKVAIIATIGDDHFNHDQFKGRGFSHQKNLEDLGFRKLVDYINPNHGTSYRQHMFILEK